MTRLEQIEAQIAELSEEERAKLREWFNTLDEHDAALQAEITASIKRGMANVEAGRTRPAKQALQQIADELGLKLNR